METNFNINAIILVSFVAITCISISILFIKRKSIRLKLLESEALSGGPETQLALAVMLFTGDKIDKDEDKANHYVELAAQNGGADMQYSIARMFFVGENLPKDKSKAMCFLQMSADNGNMYAQYNLGSILYSDKGEHNREQAVRYIKMAADNGEAQAQFLYGGELLRIAGANPDKNTIKEAFEWIEKSAEGGYMQAQTVIGSMLYFGKNIKQDKERAIHFLKLAAEQNDAQSQFLYGAEMLKSAGVNTSKETVSEAVSWIEKSANGGYIQAMMTLAEFYAAGNVYPRDQEKSLYWFTQAAEHGDPTAQATVAGFYLLSVGEDKILSYAWYMTAAKGGNEYAKEAAEKVFSELSESERDDAQRKAEEFTKLYAANKASTVSNII